MAPDATTQIEIEAPLARVWAVMLDIAAYAAWNPFIVAARGPVPLSVGNQLWLDVRWAKGGGVTSPERVTRLEAPAERNGVTRATLAYRFDGWMHALWLIRAERIQELEGVRGGAATVYRTSETFRGLLAKSVPLGDVQEGFERHALALKHRAESLTD